MTKNEIESLLRKRAEKYADNATHSGLSKPAVAYLAGANDNAEMFKLIGIIEQLKMFQTFSYDHLISDLEKELEEILR